MRDPYQVLGIDKSASAAEIKKAFRDLAKKHHPDLHQGDPVNEKKFKEINAAYELLRDEEKRKAYDAGQAGRAGFNQRAYQTGTGGGGGYAHHDSFSFDEEVDPANFFSDLFGWSNKTKPNARRGDDVRYTLEVEFIEAAKGIKKRIRLPHGKSFEVSIPAGTKHGQVLRLRGLGDPSSYGGPKGDALIEVLVKDDAYFSIDGANIHLKLPITLQEAILGGTVTIPTLSGKVNLKLPPGCNTGRKLRLKGKGMPIENDGQGDQIVTLRVMMPPEPDAELTKFIEKWGDKNIYRVRDELEKY